MCPAKVVLRGLSPFFQAALVIFLRPYRYMSSDNAEIQEIREENDELQDEEQFEKSDAFENYMLIRLPEWLGGGKDDASAFRSYHAVSLSDNCMSRYWPS